MSSFGRISKIFLKERLKFINLIFIIDILGGLYLMALNQFFGETKTVSYSGGIFMSIVVGVCLLIFINENSYDNNKYRLIPVSDKTMYFSSLLMSIVALLYLIAGETIFYLIEYKLVPNEYDSIMIGNFNTTQQYLFILESILEIILGIIFIFTAVTVIHMLINWISNFLPFRNQTIVKCVVAFIVVIVLGIPFEYITSNALNVMGINNLNSSFSAVSHVMYASMAIMVIWSIIFTIINVYFFRRWSETTK